MDVKASGLVGFLLFFLVTRLSSCTDIVEKHAPIPVLREQSPVSITEPLTNTTLFVGEDFVVRADLNVPFHPRGIIIRLWNPSTRYEHKWMVENPANLNQLNIDKTLEIPITTPPGDNYRLDVSAYTSLQGPATGVGYTIFVKVAEAP